MISSKLLMLAFRARIASVTTDDSAGYGAALSRFTAILLEDMALQWEAEQGFDKSGIAAWIRKRSEEIINGPNGEAK